MRAQSVYVVCTWGPAHAKNVDLFEAREGTYACAMGRVGVPNVMGEWPVLRSLSSPRALFWCTFQPLSRADNVRGFADSMLMHAISAPVLKETVSRELKGKGHEI